MTIAGEIMKNKDKTTPSPGQYEAAPWKKINDKITGNYTLYDILIFFMFLNRKDERAQTFIEVATYHGMQSPSANYEQVKFVISIYNLISKIGQLQRQNQIYEDN